MENPHRIVLAILTSVFLLVTICLFFARNQAREPVFVQHGSAYHSIDNSAQTISPSLVNINTASVEELTQLPEIGSVLAQRIVDYRETNGEFQSVGDLIDVPGLGDTRLELIWDLITVK